MEPELYLPNDDCANGASCPGEGVFVPQQIGNIAMDAMFVGSDADVQADLGLADVDRYPLTDEVFPVVYDGALLTLGGLMDCFARKYPERAQLLNVLIETQGYQVTFEETPSASEAELERWLDGYDRLVRSARRNAVTNEDYLQVSEMVNHYGQENRRLNAMRHWHISAGRIYLSTRINRNIDVNNYFLGDDESLINPAATNAEGADWLNAVMGDWMSRSGIPGASDDEEFSDSRSARIAWGAMNVVFGAAEVVGGVVLTVGSAAGTLVTGGASAVGVVAGGAMTIAGFEAITQGIDMWRTPNETSHSMGWLGDGAFAMMNEFGVLDEDDQASFSRYWSFAMLGLSLGGAGVLGYAGDAVQASRAGMTVRNLDFLVDAPSRALASARQAIVGVKNARFGQLIVSYAPLPSGRIAMNINGVGRVVAPHWESLTRLRLRMNTAKRDWVQYRRAALASDEAGLLSLRGGINNTADAQKLTKEGLEISGISASRFDEFFEGVVLSPTAGNSSFNIGSRTLTVRGSVGTGTAIVGPYNEFKAINEILHEIAHAQRRYQYVRQNGSLTGYERVIGTSPRSQLYAAEEVLVERTAQARLLRIAEPRIAAERLYGNAAEASRLQRLLDDAIADSNEYLRIWARRAGE